MKIEPGFDWNKRVYEEMIERVSDNNLSALLDIARKHEIPVSVRLPGEAKGQIVLVRLATVLRTSGGNIERINVDSFIQEVEPLRHR